MQIRVGRSETRSLTVSILLSVSLRQGRASHDHTFLYIISEPECSETAAQLAYRTRAEEIGRKRVRCLQSGITGIEVCTGYARMPGYIHNRPSTSGLAPRFIRHGPNDLHYDSLNDAQHPMFATAARIE